MNGNSTMRCGKARLPGVVLAAAAALGAALLLGGCDTVGGWFGKGGGKQLSGARIAVMNNETRLQPDAGAANNKLDLGPAVTNTSWAQAGGGPEHAPGHLALADEPQKIWRTDIGAGSSANLPLLGTPVIADGRLVTIDSESDVRSFDAKTGSRQWSVSVRPDDERGEAPGGGVAIGGGRVFVGSGYAEVLALDATNGAVIWRKKVAGPVRGAPTVAEGRVFVTTLDHQTIALSASDGTLLWTHSGIIESAGLLAGNSPAATSGLVVAPYSSGEVYGLRPENGRVLWQESLASVRVQGALGAISDIRGRPVIDRDIVYAISHSGRLAAVDARLGGRLWERDISGIQMPWVAGEQVFVVTNDAQVVALDRKSGIIRWVYLLQRYVDPDDKKGQIAWSGPVVAGNRLWLTASNGYLVGLLTDDGTQVYVAELPTKTFLPPIVVDQTLYVLSDDGELTAFR